MPPKEPLDRVLATAETLLAQYLEALTPGKSDPVTIDNSPPALPLLSDCARLLKAQVTKLSLLAINKPFTASAVSSVLRDTVTGCLPAMMSAVQICETQRSTLASFFVDEVGARVRRVMHEMLGLVKEVASIAAQSGNTRDLGRLADNRGRDSLSSTGIVWNGCDDITSLVTAGIADLAVQKAEAYRDTIKDAIEELREWREGDDLENEGIDDQLLDSDDEGVDGDADSLNDLFNAANSLPADRPQLRELVESAEDKLKKVVILYTAIVKRRLRKSAANPMPGDAASIQRLDKTLTILKRIPNLVDDMASTFYDLEESVAKTKLDAIINKAIECAVILDLNANGETDEFSTWLTKWKEALNPNLDAD